MADDIMDPIQIVDIESELKKLWEENIHEKKIKACLFTLIVYVKEGVRGDFIRELTYSIAKEYPFRMISISESGPSKPSCLATEVSQHTTLEGGVLVASDQISITVSPAFLERIPYIITPEIVPDLPVYVIWAAELEKNSLLTALEKFATKIIFDAEFSPSLSDYSTTCFQKIGKVPYQLQDLHWALSGGWRECLFQAFNNEEGVQFLRSLQQVRITYNDAQAPFRDILSWYVQAWLAAQLGWKVSICNLEGKKVSYTSLSGTVEVTLIPERIEKSIGSNNILSIEMKNSSLESYCFIRNKECEKVVLHVSKQDMCELPSVFPFPDYKKGFNFIRELLFFVQSDHYAKTLKSLSEMKG